MYIGVCEYCGKESEYKYRSIIKRYCSHKCANMASSKTRTKKRVELKCQYCGEKFYLLESTIKSREKHSGNPIKYCSHKCMGMAMRTEYEQKCKNCGKLFMTTRNKFCCVECVNQYKKKTGMLKKDGYWFENGYKTLYLEGNGSIKEHIKIMEDHIGRKLYDNEVVHHINENKKDNRLENLQLMTKSEHSSLHRKLDLARGKKLFGR